MTDPRLDWLKERRELVTASDAAAILGEDPHRGAFEVYAEKVGGAQALETLPMRRGRRHEGAIADEYAEETGRPVHALEPFTITRHPAIPWLGATLDRITRDTPERPAPTGCAGSAPLQIKLAIGSAREWEHEPPLWYQIQVQIEIACTVSSWGSLGGLLGPGPLHVTDTARHDGFLANALPLLEAFLDRVRRKDPPAPGGSPGDTEAVRQLWGEGNGGTVALGHDELELVHELERANTHAAEWAGAVREIKNKLRARIGEATFGALPDGSFLTLKTVHRQRYEVAEASYRMLRRWWPRRGKTWGRP